MQLSRSNKQIVIVLLPIIAVFALLLFIFNISSQPPKESKIIENFYAHRDAFEQLRNMLLADKETNLVADWGIQKVGSLTSQMPPDGGFSESRYHDYLALLREIGARAADHRWEKPEEFRFLVWRSGFAGESRHIAISWLEGEPTNSVRSLDEFYRTDKPRSPVYRHIDGNWYIWADW